MLPCAGEGLAALLCFGFESLAVRTGCLLK
jgi:hypothetical protein